MGLSRRMRPHEDQVRQVATECRNPAKAKFSHLPWLEGTSRVLTWIGDAAKAAPSVDSMSPRLSETRMRGFKESRLRVLNCA